MSGSGCGCCTCLAGAGTHVELANRPGLSAIRYRIGEHRTFLDAMIRRLTIAIDDADPRHLALRELTTREVGDPVLALFDAWAVVGDVLTFYQERIANEAFLRTAVERRSILELGRLVGYRLKPGVSASVYLAYLLDETARTVIPAASKAQSLPGPGEQPQTFETSEDIDGRGAWNTLRPRLSRPQAITIDNVLRLPSISIEGTTTRLEARDPLLFVFETPPAAVSAGLPSQLYASRRVQRTESDLERKRTLVLLEPVRPYYQTLAVAAKKLVVDRPSVRSRSVARPRAVAPLLTPAQFYQNVLLGVGRTRLQILAKRSFLTLPEVDAPDDDAAGPAPAGGPTDLAGLLAPLLKARGVPPASQWQFARSLAHALEGPSDYLPRLLSSLYPQAAETIYAALANNESGRVPYPQFRSVHVLRRRASVFGYNAPTVLFEERPPAAGEARPPVPQFVAEDENTLHLDTPTDAVAIGSYVVTFNDLGAHVATVREAETGPRTAYGISGRTTRLVLSDRWARTLADRPSSSSEEDRIRTMVGNLQPIRSTSVQAESEELVLAQELADRPVGNLPDRPAGDPESERRIELDAVVDGLQPGRWVIVSGERSDTRGTRGIVASELAMIDNVEHRTDAGPGGAAYSILALAPAGLAYQYKRETVRIFGNVVPATHGEGRAEILGAGDPAQPWQSFELHHNPLTLVAAPTMAGVTSTLAVRVNDVSWREVDSFERASPSDRVFLTRTNDEGHVSVTFGDGVAGARPPSGVDNIRVAYRSGLGRDGNVRAGQVATAISRPLGVRDVINPMAASGGADPEARDEARRNIPASLQAMGRIVSVDDYADFARSFAGIAKATAVPLSDGRRRLVHLTVGGAGDIDIDVTSDLHRNLVEALRRFGDAYQPLLVQPREKVVVVGSARVRVHPDYQWTSVGPAIRAALVDALGYDRREFGQVLFPGAVIAAIQRVPGVLYVDLDELRGLSPADIVGMATTPKKARPGARAVAATPPPVRGALPTPSAGLAPLVPRAAGLMGKTIVPAQIVYLPAELADLFVLKEITHD